MLFRIGVNLGDILIEGDDILGDGVNVAARLESIAEPGGICISSSAYDHVRGKVAVEFTDLGEQTLKNIARPIRAYAVGLSANAHQTAPLPPSAPRLSIVVLPFANIGGDQLHIHPKPVTTTLHRTFKNVPDVQLAPDLLNVNGLAFEGERRVVSDDERAADAR